MIKNWTALAPNKRTGKKNTDLHFFFNFWYKKKNSLMINMLNWANSIEHRSTWYAFTDRSKEILPRKQANFDPK